MENKLNVTKDITIWFLYLLKSRKFLFQNIQFWKKKHED